MSSGRDNRRGSQQRSGDYEYFQLCDPDDSDLELELDPDVKSLLSETHRGASRNNKRPWQILTKPFSSLSVTRTRTLWVISMGALVIVLLTLALGLGFGLAGRGDSRRSESPYGSVPQNGQLPTTKRPLTKFNIRSRNDESVLGVYDRMAISVDAEPCAEIGLDVLRRNGTAMDATVAALFCNGLVNAQSMGIGGGFLMTLYVKATGEHISLNARETAPARSNLTMYGGDPLASQDGPLSAAVPGEILGYWEAKQRYGNKNISWASLIKPSIDMCRNGIPVTFSIAENLKKKEDYIKNDPGMRSVFVNPETGEVWKEGDVYTRETLAKTLERIAEFGADEFYRGETAKKLIADMTAAGGIMTMEDLRNYKVSWTPSSRSVINNYTIASVPPPGSGPILAYILSILQHFHLTPEDDVPLTYHRMIEAFKWAYAKRSKLGDPADEEIQEYVNELVENMTSPEWGWKAFKKINDNFTVNDPEFYGGEFYTPRDHGTAHVSILAPNGDAVSVTSTVNLHFGSRYMSPSTGIIMNDEMDDFSFPTTEENYFGLPPSPNNFLKPGKRPLSSMSPAIITDEKGDVSMVIGAAGGTKITTAVAFTVVQNLWLKKELKDSIDTKRVHHQLAPMEVEYEVGLNKTLLNFLESRRHKLKEYPEGESIVMGIRKDLERNKIYANADYRKAGGVAGI